MTPEFDIRGGVRRCAKSDRALRPTDHYFSVLREEPRGLVRDDYAAEVWEGPPADAFAWWESCATDPDNAPKPAPNEVLLKLFDQWADQPEQSCARFVITLLLVRRRVFKIEPASDSLPPAEPHRTVRVYCPRRDEQYEVSEAPPNKAEAARIQEQLTELLAA
ncbi:MAG: hypothetical protein KDA37_11025 [Planctomycetales bacterium]|nr:hypothetical protein [Planctomycetales bacterium]